MQNTSDIENIAQDKVSELNEIENDKRAEFYKHIDKNNDGKLSDVEISEYLKSLNSQEYKNLSEEVFFHLFEEMLSISKQLKDKLVPAEGVTYDDFYVLKLVNEASLNPDENGPGITQASIVEKTKLSSSAVSALLDKIDEGRKELDSTVKGWITRKENIHNRREKVISITREGIKHFRTVNKGHTKRVDKITSNIDLHDLVKAYETMLKLEEIIKSF